MARLAPVKPRLSAWLNGLEQLDNGEILIGGQPFIRLEKHGAQKPQYVENAAHRLNIGMVFQGFNLFPHLTVMKNLMLAPHYHRLATDAELKREIYAYCCVKSACSSTPTNTRTSFPAGSNRGSLSPGL